MSWENPLPDHKEELRDETTENHFAYVVHDGESLTFNEAILRHGGQAAASRNSYNALSTTNKQRLIAFLLLL
jgi:CxxC motif-containing protein (DUF1111 family)